MDNTQEIQYKAAQAIARKHTEREIKKAGGIIEYIHQQSVFGEGRRHILIR